MRKREDKKAELRAQREAQKDDPVYQAKDFAARLNKDSGDRNSFAKRLQAAKGDLSKDLAAALDKDSAFLGQACKTLNECINAKDLPKIKTTMEEAADVAKKCQKHERIARAHVSAADTGTAEASKKGAERVR